MEVYCLEDFKLQYDKLLSKKSYRDLESQIVDYFFKKSVQEICSGTRLNHSSESPYIKKRIKGRGGFRVYYLLLIKNDKLYLMFVHPKTGSLGASNIADKSKAHLYKKVLVAIENNNLYKVSEYKGKLIFSEP